jgi:fructose-bisphosphate aldolase class 1
LIPQKKLFADHQGLQAMDENNPTRNKRFAKLGIPQTVEAWREGNGQSSRRKNHRRSR